MRLPETKSLLSFGKEASDLVSAVNLPLVIGSRNQPKVLNVTFQHCNRRFSFSLLFFFSFSFLLVDSLVLGWGCVSAFLLVLLKQFVPVAEY